MTVKDLCETLCCIERVSIWVSDNEHGLTNVNDEMLYCGQIIDMNEDIKMACYGLTVGDILLCRDDDGVNGMSIAIYADKY